MMLLSCVQVFAIPWTVADLAPVFLARQECQSGLPFPSLGEHSDPGIKPGSPALQADSLPSESPGEPRWVLSFRFHLFYFCPQCFSLLVISSLSSLPVPLSNTLAFIIFNYITHTHSRTFFQQLIRENQSCTISH